MNTKDIPFFAQLKPDSFEWPVKVPVPVDGKYAFVEFTGVFRYLDDAGESEMLDPKHKRTDKQILAEVLLAVKGIKFADGTEVPSTPELVASIIATDRVAPCAVGIYLGARRGLAAEKNS